MQHLYSPELLGSQFVNPNGFRRYLMHGLIECFRDARLFLLQDSLKLAGVIVPNDQARNRIRNPGHQAPAFVQCKVRVSRVQPLGRIQFYAIPCADFGG
jgi:hypothetical protein